MVTLSLLRHAKSAWNTSAATDFDRPLTSRGLKAASRMGAYIEEHGLVPDLVFCSTAERTRATLELAAKEWGAKPEIRFADALYHASPQQMLDMVRRVPAETSHVMIVGHNPGMHILALELPGSGDDDEIKALSAKYPTAALAVIDFRTGWGDIEPGTGELRMFVLPRSLG